MEKQFWRVSYIYQNPSSAGPFKGKGVVSGEKPIKGDSHYGPFGLATIKTVSKAKGFPFDRTGMGQ